MTSCIDQARTMIRLHIRGIQEKVLRSRLRSDDHGPHSDEEITEALTNLILAREVTVGFDGRLHLAEQPEEIPPGFLQAADEYRRIKELSRTRCGRVLLWLEGIFPSIAPALILLVITGFFAIGLCASERPEWALPGILDRESSSRYTEAGAVVYVDQAVGAAGELGPFQMKRDAFDQVAESGEVFERLGHDTAFAERLAIRYLDWLHLRSKRDWFIAVGRWNAGPHGDYGVAWRYAKDVQKRGERRRH
jgi:hypothetical protein